MRSIGRYKNIILNHRKVFYGILLGVVLLLILPIVIPAITIVIDKDAFYDYHLVCLEPIKNPDMARVVKTDPNRDEACNRLYKNFPKEKEGVTEQQLVDVYVVNGDLASGAI